MLAARRAALALALARPATRSTSPFHSSAPVLVRVGDALPDVELMEGSPGNKVKIADELRTGKGVIIGKFAQPVPAALPLHDAPPNASAQACRQPSPLRVQRAISRDTSTRRSLRRPVGFLLSLVCIARPPEIVF